MLLPCFIHTPAACKNEEIKNENKSKAKSEKKKNFKRHTNFHSLGFRFSETLGSDITKAAVENKSQTKYESILKEVVAGMETLLNKITQNYCL